MCVAGAIRLEESARARPASPRTTALPGGRFPLLKSSYFNRIHWETCSAYVSVAADRQLERMGQQQGWLRAPQSKLSRSRALEFYSFFGSGGYWWNFGTAGFISSHGCASEAKMSICGRNQLGSSREPARTPTDCDCPSNSPPVTRDPHSGQNPRLCFPRAMLEVKW
jgi:hypothetical protein